MAIYFFSYGADVVCRSICAGSGTTGVACKNTGRNYICIEKEKEYIDVMVERGLDLYVQ